MKKVIDKRTLINAERSKQARSRLYQQIVDTNNEIFEGVYDCSCVSVEGNCTSKIKLICKEHGPFLKRINHFINGSGCPKCTHKRKCVSTKDWIKRAHQVHHNFYDYSLLTTSTLKYSKDVGTIICPKHGAFNQSLKNHIVCGSGCPSCALEHSSNNHPKKSHISNESQMLLENREWLHERNHVHDKTLSDIAKELGTTVSTVWNRFNKYSIPTKHFHTSVYEEEIIDFLKSCGVKNIEQSNRTLISPYEVDIYIPDYQIAIEFNGNFWHTEHNGGKNKNYHRLKTIKCAEQNVNLIHIFEYQWKMKQQIIKERLKNQLGLLDNKVYARKSSVEHVSPEAKKEFFIENHLHGDARSTHNLGLIYEQQLVAVMTFVKPRYNTNHDFEMIRYAPKHNIVVCGGLSKLFKCFTLMFPNQSIITYADCCWSVGKSYENLGFEFSHFTKQPNYVYVKPPEFTPLSRQRFQKHKLKDELEHFDPNLTEWENMTNNGYDRIWDCGHAVWSYGK